MSALVWGFRRKCEKYMYVHMNAIKSVEALECDKDIA